MPNELEIAKGISDLYQLKPISDRTPSGWLSKKIVNSTKLFYKKYIAKIDINNPLTHMFLYQQHGYFKLWDYDQRYELIKHIIKIRKQTKPAASNPLLLVDKQISTNEVIQQITKKFPKIGKFSYAMDRIVQHINWSPKSWNEMLLILDTFRNIEKGSYRLRTEGAIINVYSNDPSVLLKLRESTDVSTLWRPKSEAVAMFLLENPDLVITGNAINFDTKVVLKSSRNNGSVELYNFIQNNQDKFRVSKYTLRALKDGYTTDRSFVYTNEKHLILIETLFGHRILKTEKCAQMPKDL